MGLLERRARGTEAPRPGAVGEQEGVRDIGRVPETSEPNRPAGGRGEVPGPRFRLFTWPLRRAPAEPDDGPGMAETAARAAPATPAEPAELAAAGALAQPGGFAGPAALTRAVAPGEPEATAGADHATAEDQDGEVVVAGGRIEVRNPRGRGRWPLIVVPPDGGVELRVNGRPRTGETVLRAEDEIVLLTRLEEQPGGIEVDLDDDELGAWVTVQPAMRVTTVLSQPLSGSRVELSGIPLRETLPLATTAAEVRSALQSEGVAVEPDGEAIAYAIAHPGERVQAARGRAPEPGAPARVWSCVHGELAGPPVPGETGAAGAGAGGTESAAGQGPAATVRTVPAPEAGRPPLVAAGEPVLQLTPGTPSRSGLTVGGRVLARPVWLPALAAGPGVMLSSDGCTAIAAATGCPEVRVGADEIWVCVRPTRDVAGDLDRDEDGVFEGDLRVAGDVVPGRSVCATGNVSIGGRATRSRLVAGGGITVQGGVSGSLLLGGGAGLCYAQALPLCREMQAVAARLRGPSDPDEPAWRQLARLAARLMAIFAEAERDELPMVDPAVRELAGLLPSVARAARAVAPAAQVGGRAAAGGARPATALLAATGTARGAGALAAAPPSPVVARAAQAAADQMGAALRYRTASFVQYLDNSRIESTGDVVVGGAGAARSQIVTLGTAEVRGPFRGGSVRAARGARFASLGSTDGVPTRVEIAAGAWLEAGEVHAGTVIVQGRQRHAFERAATDVRLRPVEPTDD